MYIPKIDRIEDDGSRTAHTLIEEAKIDALFAALDLDRPVGADPMEALRLDINRLRDVERRWSEACEIARANCPVSDGESHIRNGIPRLAAKARELLEEIEKWKDASGLERGGDPDGVTPDDLRNELDHLRTTQEKSWGAADEALLAEHEVEKARVVLVIQQFCGQCEAGGEPGSCPDCLLHAIGGGKQ
jgi:hypothetical protein